MSYFVRINDARGVRRRILESSKEMLYALKGHYRMLELRDKKREAAEELRATMNGLAELSTRLQALLPVESLKEIEQYLPKRRKAPKRKEAEAPETPKDDVGRLEKALANIEERLRKL